MRINIELDSSSEEFDSSMMKFLGELAIGQGFKKEDSHRVLGTISSTYDYPIEDEKKMNHIIGAFNEEYPAVETTLVENNVGESNLSILL